MVFKKRKRKRKLRSVKEALKILWFQWHFRALETESRTKNWSPKMNWNSMEEGGTSGLKDPFYFFYQTLKIQQPAPGTKDMHLKRYLHRNLSWVPELVLPHTKLTLGYPLPSYLNFQHHNLCAWVGSSNLVTPIFHTTGSHKTLWSTATTQRLIYLLPTPEIRL